MSYNVTMNRNNIKKIAQIFSNLSTNNEVENFLNEIFTQNELETLSKRWRIMELLFQGKTQREIVQELNVSLCKVTRGSKILKDENAITTKILKKEKQYGI